MELTHNIINATTEIFATMVMMEVAPCAPLPSENKRNGFEITGMVGLAGLYKGMLAIHLPARLAKGITGNFLGLEVEEIDEDVQDAVGEVANMLGGCVKAMLSENGKDIELSLPSIVCGNNYNLQHKEDVDVVIVPFKTQDGEFLVELQIQKNAETGL